MKVSAWARFSIKYCRRCNRLQFHVGSRWHDEPCRSARLHRVAASGRPPPEYEEIEAPGCAVAADIARPVVDDHGHATMVPSTWPFAGSLQCASLDPGGALLVPSLTVARPRRRAHEGDPPVT